MGTEDVEVIFLDDDKTTVLDRQFVKVGEKVWYHGETPTKAPTATEKYSFNGWTNEEKLEEIRENTILVAKYSVETFKPSEKDALYNASLENAQKSNLNSVVQAGNKVNEQQKAFEKDTRTAEQIVSDVMKNGKTEIGQDINKDDIEK